MNQSSLCAQAHLSRLVLVDMQIRLAAVMPPAAMLQTQKNCAVLLQAAQLCEVPSVYSEHYPKGLGGTLEALTPLLQHSKRIEKTSFACTGTSAFKQQMTRDKPQVVLAGMETHICVLQTALGLLQMDFTVFVAEDAIVSRNPENKANAIARMRTAGCVISNTESIVFEWMQDATHPQFKAISALIR